MNRLCIWLFFGTSVIALSQQTVPASSQIGEVTLAAVSRDDTMLVGGISCCGRTKQWTIAEEPIARLTLSGHWEDLTHCGPTTSPTLSVSCRKFQHEFLDKSHTYTVVSADGKSAVVHVGPTKLGDCFDYAGTGTYSGADIQGSAIAASSTDFFTDSEPPQLLRNIDTKPILDAVASRIPSGLDSRLYFKFFSLQLEGQNFILVKRSVADYAGSKDSLKYLEGIFAIGIMKQGRFQILLQKQDEGDERVLGTIRLKSERNFLITSVNDSESQIFCVYGIRNGKLVIVYSGGGSEC